MTTDGFVANQIARTNRNFLVANLVLLAVLGGILLLSARYINNLVLGPNPVSPTYLLGVTDPDSIERYYVNVTVDEVIPTGVVHVTTRTRNGIKESETTDAAYYALRLGDKFLLAKRSELDASGEHVTLTGSLEQIDSKERTEVIESVERQNPELQGKFLAYKLDATPFAHGGIYAMLIALGLLGLFGLFNVLRWVLRVIDQRNHPILQSLSKLGDLSQMVPDVNASLPARSKDRMLSSPRWIAGLTEFGVNLHRTQDVVWAHVTRNQQRTYGVNTGKSFAITIYDRWGKSSQVNFGRKEAPATEFMGQLKTTVPWVILGYSDEVATLWRKDRAQLIQLVEQRRRQTA